MVHVKQAQPGDPAQALRNAKAIQSVLGLGLAGLGVGAGARGMLGIRRLLWPEQHSLAPSSPVPSSLPIMLPRIEEEEEREGEEPLRKAAAALKAADPQWWQVPSTMCKAALQAWQIPASAVLAGSGLAGGWTLMDKILDARRKSEQNRELEDAQQEYEDIIRRQYELSMKSADAQGLDAVFDSREQLTKCGGDWWEGIKGAYILALLASAGGGAYGGWQMARAGGNKQRMAQALQERKRHMSQQPQPIYAFPQEKSFPPLDPALKEEEREIA